MRSPRGLKILDLLRYAMTVGVYLEAFVPVRGEGSGLSIFVRVANSHLLVPPSRGRIDPVVVLHGGPGLPHNYLLHIADMITDRPVVFYDQLGCGRSSAPADPTSSVYSVRKSVEDLHQVLCHFNFPSVVLLGHSWGGTLAYEYATSDIAKTSNVTALVLSNTSTSSSLTQREIRRKIGELIMDGVVNEDLDAQFRSRHQCRVESSLLSDTLKGMSHIPSWSGLHSILSWEIDAASSLGETKVLVIQGEFDFSTPRCMDRWASVARQVEFVTIPRSSHMPHIENPSQFRFVILNFLSSLTAN